MALIRTLGLVTALAALATLPVLSMPNAMNNMANSMSTKELKANMGAQNGSNQTGTAMVKNVPGGVRVTIRLDNASKSVPEPAHIHQGTCAKLNPAPWKPLSSVVAGRSITVVKGVTVAQLKKAHYAINVHQSAAHLTQYVSCGDL